MKSIALSGIAAVVTVLAVGCAAEAEPEEAASTSSDLSAACVTQIKAKPGTPQWRAELQKCIDDLLAEAKGGGGTTSGGGTSGGGTTSGGVPGGGKPCSVSIGCSNGTCRCGAGPNAGKVCDGWSTAGASSCSVLCRSCT